MYLTHLSLKNIACFEDITLDFTDKNGKPCPWVVLLGENGTGKSTILQMLGLSLLHGGTLAFHEVANNISWSKFPRTGSIEGEVDLGFLSTRDDKGNQKENASFRRSLTLLPQGGVNLLADRFVNLTQFDDTLFSPDITNGWFVAGYRPWRQPSAGMAASRETSYATPSPKPFRFASLFDEEAGLTDIREWLADLDFRQLKETNPALKKQAQKAFRLATEAIVKTLPNPNVKFVEVTPTKDAIVEENGVLVSIDSLSGGYRSTMAWVGDLVRRLVEAFPDKRNPLEAEGVVLLDEIDLQLHPRWQRTIVEQIRALFPNLQFIVTTHSPFVAQDMREQDKIIVLQRQGDKVSVVEEAGFVQGWRVDQILTSYLFGLKSTRDNSIEQAEAERQSLLDQEAQHNGHLAEQDRQKLNDVQQLIARVKSSPEETATESDQQSLQEAAETILELLAAQAKA